MVKIKEIKPIFFATLILYLVVLCASVFFDASLSLGILLVTLLSLITVGMLFKSGVKDKKVYWLFLIALVVHFVAMALIYYNHFYPFGGGAGDQAKYHQVATELSVRFQHGDFSIKGFDRIYPDLYVSHFYPVVLGALYAITLPSIIIGESFNVWLIALTVIFLYLLAKEIGSKDVNAFLIGLVATIYPSYLYFGSLLLRDAIVICFSIISLFLMVKIIKNFSWPKLLWLLLTIGVTLHFRLYIGLVLLLVLFISWSIINLDKKKKISYGLVMLVLLGFLPQIFTGQGYYGITFFKKFLNAPTITFLRETAYQPSIDSQNTSFGTGSSIVVKTGFDNPIQFVKNSAISAAYVFLGPMPWHIKYPRHLFSLVETIPWYFILIFIFIGVKSYYKKGEWKVILPLVAFCLIIFLMLGFYLNNFGAYMRIRIPGFLALLVLADFSWLIVKINSLKTKLTF